MLRVFALTLALTGCSVFPVGQCIAKIHVDICPLGDKTPLQYAPITKGE